uniref:Signal sequence receptor subunit 2 n=1 Tax=Microcebus murinus TaxID=30608 RepID=A0A8C5XW96_MICMU
MRLLASVVLALFAVTQAEEGAKNLASKSLLNRYAVEGRDLTLQYNIYNVGSRVQGSRRGAWRPCDTTSIPCHPLLEEGRR